MMKLNIQLFANGTIEFAKAGSSYKTIQGKIEWSESEVSIENNTSKIHTKLYAKVGTGGTTGKGWSGKVIVNNIEHSFSSLSSSTTIKGTYVLLKEYDDTITHENDGSKKITISGSVTGPSGTTISGVTSSGSEEVTLETIPRASEITATNADIGTSSIIVINKKNDSFTTTLKYKFANQTVYTTIVEKTGEKTYGWQIPTNFYSLIPNAQYGPCSIEAITYNGDTQIGDPKYVDINIFANETLCKPTISNTSIIDTNTKSIALTEDNTKFIKYVSTPKLTWNASAKNGASLKSQNINNISATSPYQTNWADSFKLDVTDSRNYTSTYNYVLSNVVDYFYPQITASGKRKTSTSSNIILNLSGKFFKGNFSDSIQNTATFECKYKEKYDSNWTTISIEPTINEDGSFLLQDYDLGAICDYQNSWQFSIVITDKITSQSSNFPITVGEPNHYWYKKNGLNYFKVNGNLNVKNKIQIPLVNTGGIYNKDDKLILGNYDNDAVALNATGTSLFLGFLNTTQINMFDQKVQFYNDGSIVSDGQVVPTYKGWASDADTCLTEGRYYCHDATSGLPGTNPYGYLRVRVSNGDTINHTTAWGWQEFYNTSGEKYIRSIVNKDGWTSWRKMAAYEDGQNILWKGTYYMKANQTASLSQPISSQKNGIVLVISGYSNGAVQNNNHTYYFVPKKIIELYPGGAVLVPCGGTEGVIGFKYLYINDDSVAGNDNNNTSNNQKWVLTYVIGV